MKQYILKLIIFLLPFVIIIGSIESRLSKIPNSYSFKKRHLEAKLTQYEILVLGNSHAFRGINPALFSHNGFNMANKSQPLYCDEKILEKYIDRMPNLKVVIISVSYPSLELDYTRTVDKWRSYFYEYYYGFSLSNENKNLDLRRISLIALYGREEVMDILFKGFDVNLAENINKYGFMNEPVQIGKSNEISPQTAKERINLYQNVMDCDCIPVNAGHLKRMLEMLKFRHIKAVLVTPPIYQTCYRYVDPKKYREMQDVLIRISQQYTTKYLNYMMDKRFVIKHFLDNDHLNSLGAAKLTGLIEEEIEDYW